MRIGLAGAGNVGGSLFTILQEKHSRVSSQFQVTAVFDRSYDRKKGLIGDVWATRSASEFINSGKFDVMVETVGGCDTALFLVREALDKGIPVITANKALLAGHGLALFRKSADSGTGLYFEAAVAGGIPVIQTVLHAYSCDEITGISGILNGTTNYILSRMREDNLSFENALELAQQAGFAEADPSADIDGHDAAAKLCLLASLISGAFIEKHRINVSGIRNIRIEDIRRADHLGYRIKLVAEAETDSLQVTPMLVPQSHFLYPIENEFNAISIRTLNGGEQLLAGRGAGGRPTAFSLLGDLYRLKNQVPSWNYSTNMKQPLAIAELNASLDRKRSWYIRLEVPDEPGIFAGISQKFQLSGISLASVTQPPAAAGIASIVLLTHPASHDQIFQIRQAIEPTLLNPPVIYPVIENL